MPIIKSAKKESIKRIFISHASKDSFVTDAFIDLVLDTGLGIDVVKDVFCTSYDGTKIKTGEDWRESIRSAIENASIVFLFISPFYKESEVCQNEMGAAWVLNSNTIPFVIEPLTYDNVGVLAETKQLAKLFDEKTLDEIKDRLIQDLQLPTTSMSSSRWTAKKKEILVRCKDYFSKPENKYPLPITRDEFEKQIEEKVGLEQVIVSQSEELNLLKEKVNALKKAKDSVEVQKIEKQYSDDSTIDEFEEKSAEVAKLLNANKGIINGIIFNDFFNKGLTIDWQTYKPDIDEAVGLNEVDGEELTVNWGNRKMKKIRQALEAFNSHMYQIQDDEAFMEYFDKNYKCDFEMNNMLFWKKVFATSVYVN